MSSDDALAALACNSEAAPLKGPFRRESIDAGPISVESQCLWPALKSVRSAGSISLDLELRGRTLNKE